LLLIFFGSVILFFTSFWVGFLNFAGFVLVSIEHWNVIKEFFHLGDTV
jgi:hypothetical protein